MSGEFIYDRDDHLWGVRDGHSRPVHKRIKVPLPLDNIDALVEMLDSKSTSSRTRTSEDEIRRLFIEKEILEPATGIGLATVAPSIWAASILLYARTKGTLEGFEVSDGRHYPRFSFMDKNGIRHSSVDMRHPLEDAYDDVAIMRMVREDLPRSVTVRYRRGNLGDCYCEL